MEEKQTVRRTWGRGKADSPGRQKEARIEHAMLKNRYCHVVEMR